MSEPIEQVIARSSLGGHAWCANCKHPDAVHLREMCAGENGDTDWCDCPQLRRMSPDEWFEWKYGESE